MHTILCNLRCSLKIVTKRSLYICIIDSLDLLHIVLVPLSSISIFYGRNNDTFGHAPGSAALAE
jgi:hypothetical protein